MESLRGLQAGTPQLRPIGALPPTEEEEGYSRASTEQVPHFELGETQETESERIDTSELAAEPREGEEEEEEEEETVIEPGSREALSEEGRPSETTSSPAVEEAANRPSTPTTISAETRPRRFRDTRHTRFVPPTPPPEIPIPQLPRGKPKKRGTRSPRKFRGPPRCIVARTALILPFAFATAGEDKFLDQTPGEWLELLVERTVTLANGEVVPLWEVYKDLPFEVSELSPQFRQLVGWKEKGRKFIETWRARRLTLRKQVLDALFSNARLWALERGDTEDYEVSKRVRIDKIELHLLPMGSGILVVFVDWLPHPVDGMRLEDLRKWLSVSKFRHTVPKVALGWSFAPLEPRTIDTIPTPAPEDISRRRRSRSLASYKRAKWGEWSPEPPMRHREDQSQRDTQPSPAAPPPDGHGAEGTGAPAGLPAAVAGRVSRQHAEELGPRLAHALYGERPVSLSTIGNWLLALSDERPGEDGELPQRVTYGRYLHHHTVAVLERRPTDEVLYEYLYHLRRAFEATNVPPPNKDEAFRLDDLLIPRKNRYVGISREGNISLSWPLKEQKQGWEQKQWPKKFLGIFLLLALHIHGERVVLDELSYLTSLKADSLTLGAEVDYEELLATRQLLRDLATLMIRYTLSMSSDDCGGPSAYSEFFTAMRDVLRVPDARNELREEIDDVLGLVESGYSEERRRRKILAKREMAMWNHIRETSKRRFELIISILTAFTLPLVVLSGIFGMNLSDLPDPSFGPLIGVTMGLSLLFVFALLVYLVREKKSTEKKIASIRETQTFKEMEKEEEALDNPKPGRKTLRQLLQGRPSRSSMQTTRPSRSPAAVPKVVSSHRLYR